MSGAERLIARAAARRRALSDADLQKELYAALYGHCQAEVALCAGAASALEPRERQRVIGVYGETEAWRWCATDDLQTLVGCMDELMRRADIAASNDAKPVGPSAEDQAELDLSGGETHL